MNFRKKTSVYLHRNRVALIGGGLEYFDKMEFLINNARYLVHVQVYIFEAGETGNKIASALIKAAGRGVKIYVLADGYASQSLPRSLFDSFTKAGIKFKFFEPLLKSTRFYFGRRLHQKVFVADALYSLVGGINIADHYNEIKGKPAWKDYAIYIEGETSVRLHNICNKFWKEEVFPSKQLTEEALEYSQQISPSEYCSLRVRRNDWLRGHRQVVDTYFNLINQSQHSIIIMCSYFLPGKSLLNRIKTAVKDGIKVKIILAGPSDVLIAKKAERYLYHFLLKHKIEIYEYQPTVLHAKLAVADSRFVTIGSFNINNISAFASIELNIDVRNKPFAIAVHNEIEKVIKNDCLQITSEYFLKKLTWYNKFINLLSYYLIRIIFNISTFYYRRF